MITIRPLKDIETDGIIAICNWKACENCLHRDKEVGGCKFTDEQFNEELGVDGEFVHCGWFRDDETEQARQAYHDSIQLQNKRDKRQRGPNERL